MPDFSIIKRMLDEIEDVLKSAVDATSRNGQNDLYKMLTYHMGWSSEGITPGERGKRIRPLLVLLTNAANDGDWSDALPAAAAVELIHNFSLIHDDIQDNSPLRRGRPTVWKIWGIPQAINAGDLMFTLAQIALLDLETKTTPKIALQASRILQTACHELTAGQYLDIAHETLPNMELETYWKMIAGKTAALLAASTSLGALIAQVDVLTQKAYQSFGFHLGLAFQIQDDYLGLWGDSNETGKSTESDLVSGKKTLPILFGLQKGGLFAERWRRGSIKSDEVPTLVEQLENEGAREYNYMKGKEMMNKASAALKSANPRGEAGKSLYDLVDKLSCRIM